MILHRIATALRRQDWFTVFVETLIVLFGVFFGLQVNGWDEAQADWRPSKDYAVSLISDFEQTGMGAGS